MEVDQTANQNARQTIGDASTGKAASAQSGLAGDFDNFLVLLTTQLQHQDPLSPTDTNEFTNQLVQFANVEQQILQNKNLENLIELQSQNQAVGALSFIGQTIEAAGTTNMLVNGEATFSYRLPETASSASIAIFDAAGELVFQDTAPPESGLHDIVWDGSTLGGGTAEDGAYTFLVSAVDADDAQIEVTHGVVGKVTGVSFVDGSTILGIGDVGVPLDRVTGILESQKAASTES
jgi:flagellar basal-body rod modification protein FlgD